MSASPSTKSQSPTRTRSRALIVHALHKSASMFLFQLFQELADKKKLPFYSIHRELADQKRASETVSQSFVQCPIRSFNLDDFQYPNLESKHHVVQVRDPRDILVSQYFSIGWIHSDQGWSEEEKERRQRIQGMSIDDYVLNESEVSKISLLDRYRPALAFRNSPDCTFVRYEEMVLDFRDWLRPIVDLFDFRLAWLVKRQLVNKFAHQFETSGEKQQHRRKITPGDYLEKLQAETIEALNQQFAEVLEAFGYLSDGP